MRDLRAGAGTLTAEQKAKSWNAVSSALDAEPRRTRRRKLRLIAAGVTGAAVLTATAAIVASRPVTDFSVVECRSYTADGTSLMGTEVSNATRTGEPGSITDAVAACADFWRTGLLIEGVPGIHPAENWDGQLDGQLPVPPLVGCTRDDGAAAVVVGDTPEACANAGYVPSNR